MARLTLPIDPHVPGIVAAVRERRAAVVVAPPGAGKTTRVPPALAEDGPVIVLQPRRVAARSLARRIASEQGATLGDEVGWQVRFERRFTPRTRVLVATEGVLTARLQSDPLLSGFATVVLDEFHERSLHADLALALARQAAGARGDLRIVVISATLEARAVADFLGGCPVIEVPGRPYPVDVSYAPGAEPAAAAREAFSRGAGHLLCFLPGAAEIRRAAAALAPLEAQGARVLPLHGSLAPEEQDAALAPSQRRKLILATNIAETSLTVEGVDDVVDSGLHKVARYDAARGVDRLETERVPRDSAEQRAGRAGRTGPGRCLRLWDPRDRLRPHREPEISRVDLAGPLLEVIAWGGDPRSFEWFEAPPAHAVDAALELLVRLGAVDGARLTPLGELMRRLPLHPRLARVLVEAGGGPRAAAACAVLSEPLPLRPARAATDCDVLAVLDAGPLQPHAEHAAREIARLARDAATTGAALDDDSLRRALLRGYPDRVARRRAPGAARVLLASGHGAAIGRESGVRDAEWLVALDVVAGDGERSEARVRMASRVEPEWLAPTRRDVEHRLDAAGRVRATERAWYGAIPLAERPAEPDPEQATRLLAAALREHVLGAEGERLRRRLRFAGIDADFGALAQGACAGRTTLPRLAPEDLLPRELRQALARLAPDAIRVPSGRSARLHYREDGSLAAAVKLQELFGLGETPRVGPRREPVLLELLAPNGRPVQTTRDLRSFWQRTYPEVRKELRGRYPRHAWPEDPWTAEPTARAKKRPSS
jgi:ATP-dependent helicase HrpB